MTTDAPALFTDLYELKMLEAYLQEGMTAEAVFTLFVRRLPPQRNYLLACGLEMVLDYLEDLRFDEADIAYLDSLGHFSTRCLEALRTLRFEGEVRAVPEGTPVFANEPILEVRAPLPQAQLVETFVMNQIHLQTLLASKAARVVTAAQGRVVVDFGARRMHGVDAALKAARAFHIAGVTSTSNVLAGRVYGLPVAGTMAHSYVQAHDDESEAFRAFANVFPDTTMLVDTYDTLDGVRRVIELSRELGERFRIAAVRLDSGDLAQLARESRALLDEAGLQRVQIFASGGLDEHVIADLVREAPIDAFGVGTSMGVSADKPDLDIVYKLAEYAGKGRLKLSADKPVLPGAKQVFRIVEGGRAVRDVIAGADEQLPGRPLLELVMRNGSTLPRPRVTLDAHRRYAQQELALLPDAIRSIEPAREPYPVEISAALAEHQRSLTARIEAAAASR
ncbi:MAG TPA: nicotinate phosphoribosyltransferase [Steroidobacter sp.]|jgi:nicotinate phosphoribosyltransferase|nr:nicotinate phosphoribosyltransferase [Steroidobacteraceae bacterium]HLS80035.1 nicotinate phosphoribosyltransferase [Steroidobacter sp.]